MPAQPAGTEFQVNTHTNFFQYFPSVATDSDGDFVVVWTSYPQEPSLGIFAQRYASNGSPVGTEFQVNTYTTHVQRVPVVSATAAGDFVVVWASYTIDEAFLGVFGQRYASEGSRLGSEFQINTYSPATVGVVPSGHPAVSAASAGDFVVVWESYTQDGSGVGVFGQRYASDGSRLGSEFQVNTDTTSDQYLPAVAADGDGDFVVVWTNYASQDGQYGGVFGQRYASSGSRLGAEFQVNTYTTSTQRAPAVAAGHGGAFVVVWESYMQDGSSLGVFGQRYASSGSPRGKEFQVNTYTTDLQVVAALSADSDGDFVVVWDSYTQDGSGPGVFGQRYKSSGAPLGTEFQINTYTTGAQRVPAVSANNDGDFVVVWASYMQDGSSEGIFGQRYQVCDPPGQLHQPSGSQRGRRQCAE